MKLNLLLDNPSGTISNFYNIDPFQESNKEGVFRGEVTNLDWIADNGEVETIIARNILEYFPIKVVPIILMNWLKKLKVDGTLIVSGLDFEEVSRALILGTIEPPDASKLLYGSQEKDWEIRKSGLTLHMVIDFLETIKFKVMKKRLEKFYYTVESKREI